MNNKMLALYGLKWNPFTPNVPAEALHVTPRLESFCWRVQQLAGDGGFAQYMAELLTAVQHNMNITHVLLNNGQLGKIAKEQRAGDWTVWQTSLHNPNFAEYANICGAFGVRVESVVGLDDAIASAIAHDGPALVEVITDPELV